MASCKVALVGRMHGARVNAALDVVYCFAALPVMRRHTSRAGVPMGGLGGRPTPACWLLGGKPCDIRSSTSAVHEGVLMTHCCFFYVLLSRRDATGKALVTKAVVVAPVVVPKPTAANAVATAKASTPAAEETKPAASGTNAAATAEAATPAAEDEAPASDRMQG